MSATDLKAAIRAATTNDPMMGCHAGSVVTGREGLQIAQKALLDSNGQFDGIDAEEAKVLGDLFARMPARSEPGQMMTMACPESPNAVDFTPAAIDTFKAMYREAGVDSPILTKDRISDTLARVRLGEPLAQAPDVSGMKHVFLQDRRLVDGTREEAYVDPNKSEFYLKVTGAGMAGPETIGPHWFGPLALGKPMGSNFTVASRAKLMDKLDEVLKTGAEWRSGGLPMGPAFREVPLSGPAIGTADGFNYSAMVAAGSVNPMAPATNTDPNRSTMVFLKRTGGIAGLTQYHGPFSIAPKVEPQPNPGQQSPGQSPTQQQLLSSASPLELRVAQQRG